MIKVLVLHLIFLCSSSLFGQNDSLKSAVLDSQEIETKTRIFLWRVTEMEYRNNFLSVKSVRRRWFTGNLLLLKASDALPVRRIKTWNESGKPVAKSTFKPSTSRYPKFRKVVKEYHENGRLKSKTITKRKKMSCQKVSLGESRTKHFGENGRRIRIEK